jgi:threonine dehydrogenase-like Zn-dependent dehydrogenase
VTMYGRDADDSFRTRLVQDFGAEYVSQERIDFEQENVESNGVDLVLECTGSDEVMLAASQLLRSCGIMVWLGSTRLPRPKSHNVEKLMRDGLIRNHLHVGCVNAAPRDFRDALAHLALLKRTFAKQLAALITARVRLEDSLWHYEHRQPQGIKTVIEYT